jgi:hypothetical protein
MFRAAYLSYSAQFHIDAPSSFAYNVAQHILHVAAAAEQGAGIVVCPEYGISGFSNMPKSDWVSGGWYETWADPGDDAWNVPCTAPDHYPEAPSLVSLSCAAREHSISVVASIPRLQDGQLYNVALAFTESGRLVSYAKQNLWGESAYIDVPEGNHPTTFTTDAGVTFGLVVCADLIYKSPVLDLVGSGVSGCEAERQEVERIRATLERQGVGRIRATLERQVVERIRATLERQGVERIRATLERQEVERIRASDKGWGE